MKNKRIEIYISQAIVSITLTCIFIYSCQTYSFLNFNNQTNETIYVEYIQNNETLKQEIGIKEEMNLMFPKRWTDKNMSDVAGKIQKITIYTTTDTLLSVSNKEEIFALFKKNRSDIFKDMISIKIGER